MKFGAQCRTTGNSEWNNAKNYEHNYISPTLNALMVYMHHCTVGKLLVVAIAIVS